MEATEPRHRRRMLIRYPRLVPAAIFLLVIAITALSVFAIERGANQREHALLARAGVSMASALERRSTNSTSFLRAGAALFSTQENVDRDLFRRFVAELGLEQDFRGAGGIGWAPSLSADDVPALEAELARSSPGDARIFPAANEGQRERFVPVLYLLPETARNRRAVGYDMYSEEVRRAAMDEAARAVRPTASGPIVLVQEGEGTAPGFLVYMPVFEGKGGARELKGFIYSPYNAQDFLASAAELVDTEGLNIALFDREAATENPLASILNSDGEGRSSSREVLIANRPMTLTISAPGTGSLSPLSMATLLFGLAVASLLMLVARLLTQQATEDQRALSYFAEQDSIRDSLTRELNHRVKNTLANVLSIIALTRRRSDSVKDFADGLDGRVRALSATHDLLTQSEWGTTPIAKVVTAELAPYAHDDDHEIECDGPEVELAPNDALTLGLALHELSTNASKYGSLSVSGGKVSVTWSLVTDRLAKIRWVESGGPNVVSDPVPGFGTELIQKIVAHELHHPVDLAFDAKGVRCTLMVPVREPSDFRMRAGSRAIRGH